MEKDGFGARCFTMVPETQHLRGCSRQECFNTPNHVVRMPSILVNNVSAIAKAFRRQRISIADGYGRIRQEMEERSCK